VPPRTSVSGQILDTLRSINIVPTSTYVGRLIATYETYRGSKHGELLQRLQSVGGLANRRSHISKAEVIRLLLPLLNQITSSETHESSSRAAEPHDAAKGVARRSRRVPYLQPSSSDRFTAELIQFQEVYELQTAMALWQSAASGTLYPQPERIAQASLATFLARPAAPNTLFREATTGRGYIDILVQRGNVFRLIEVKVTTRGSRTRGASQVAAYAKKRKLDEAWLVTFDARPHPRRALRTRTREFGGVRVHTVVIDANPVNPSSLG